MATRFRRGDAVTGAAGPRRYRIAFLPSARRQFDRLPHSVRSRLEPRLAALADEPRPTGVVALQGEDRLLRLRVGDYRIVYRVDDDVLTIVVVRVGHRSKVYR